MRLLKKSEVTMGMDWLFGYDFFKEVGSGDKVRIISNGRRAIAM